MEDPEYCQLSGFHMDAVTRMELAHRLLPQGQMECMDYSAMAIKNLPLLVTVSNIIITGNIYCNIFLLVYQSCKLSNFNTSNFSVCVILYTKNSNIMSLE